MNNYIGTKQIKAESMRKEAFENFKTGRDFTENHIDDSEEGYKVEYPDGYISWSPKETFEAAYRTNGNYTYGHAVLLSKQGKKLQRVGWNGSGMYFYYVEGNTYPANTEIARREFGENVPYRPYLALKTAQNDIAMWSPSTSDCLAEDWQVVD